MEPQPPPAPTRRRMRVVVGSVLVALLLTGCGLRLETPPPAEPGPDTIEIVRRTAVTDALFVAEQADAVIDELGDRRRRLVAELERVAADSREQADQLGGVYDSGLQEPADPPSGSPQSSPADAVGPDDVVAALADASGRNRTAAGTTADGPLARLLASVGAAQAVSATRVGEYTDSAPPPVVPQLPGPAEVDAAVADDPAPAEDARDDAGADGSAEPTVTAPPDGPEDGAEADETPAEGDPARTGVSSTSPDSGEPAVVPEGLTAADLRTLVASEHSAGYAVRLRAAIRPEDERSRYVERADVHTDRAAAWALVAGTDGTAQDPRQAAYAVPRRPGDRALVRSVENDLATTYATLVGTTAPDTRTVLVDLLVESALTLDAWGAEPVPFPGLPEQRPEEATDGDGPQEPTDQDG
ncbi:MULTISPECIES: DUF4439 domain-containing protein [unclassified Isoptericola]|uniref:DUF4439 domain-containing protein n=1 Tax=unclassified Isoptericola TaxID=2623355 RepID=UPI0027125E0F|nr:MULTISPECIES: DUF4439 domain-containing protein [unclassified Isoptericola]MDO8144582.1 DUF4439 domain-containing protein [Isoptericola sp. 178]MDO8148426.1 DUF4439 domain-containing protein [Isoptericola sp. b515]MDO8151908.1 DUF4439 domain-containing protein [Isoptericola sp. b408]